MPMTEELRMKAQAGKPVSVNKEERTIDVVMTTKKVDRDGDVVHPDGLDVERFLETNPVVLWMHDRTAPIGKVIKITKNKSRATARVKFANTPLANEIFELYADGFLNAWSIGFMPDFEKMEPITDKEGRITGFDIPESELLELSAVTIPANPDALSRRLLDGEIKALGLRSAIAKELGVKDFAHTNDVAEEDPQWGSVDKDALPREATVDGEYPHHWIQNADNKDEETGVWTTGIMLLHRRGLDEAWVRALEDENVDAIDHLREHREALGLDTDKYFLLQNDEICQVLEGGWKQTNAQISLAETAFEKSVNERGKGGFPVRVKFGAEPGVRVVFEVMDRKEDGTITQAKIHSVSVELSAKQTTEGDSAGGSPSDPDTSKSLAVAALARADADLALLDVDC